MTLPPNGFTDSPNLAGFDGHARKIIRRALAYGWLAKRSNRGHMLLYAPDGLTTTSISRNMTAPHRREHAIRPIEKWKRQQAIDNAAPASEPAAIPDSAVDQPAPVVERRRAHLRSVGA